MSSSAAKGYYRFVTVVPYIPDPKDRPRRKKRARKTLQKSAADGEVIDQNLAEDDEPANPTDPEAGTKLVQLDRQSCIERFKHQHVTRIQLIAAFLHVYLPSRRDRSMDHLQYATMLPDLVASSSLLQASCDSISYAFLGTLHKDQELIQRARIHYISALSIVRALIEQPTQICLRKDLLLAAMILLAHCESFECIALPGAAPGWLQHITGAQIFLNMHGPSMFQSPLAKMLRYTIRHYTAVLGLLRRKAVPPVSKEWLSTDREDEKRLDRRSLVDAILKVPAMLERCDEFNETPTLQPKAIALAVESWKMRMELVDCFQRLHGEKGVGYKVIDLSEATIFTGLCDDKTFEDIFFFPCTQVRDQHCFYWITRFYIDSTLLKFMNKAKLPDILMVSYAPTFTRAFVQHQAFLAASNLCRSFPISNEPEELTFSPVRPGARASALAGPRDFFKEHGYVDEYHWCCNVISAVDASGNVGTPDQVSAHPSWEVKCKTQDLTSRLKMDKELTRLGNTLDDLEAEHDELD